MVVKARKPPRAPERSAFSLVRGDAAAMGVWVLLSSVFEELSAILASRLGIPPLVAALSVLCTGLALYDPVCAIVGGKGASFNPSQNFAFAAAGRGSLRLHLARSLGQTAGGVLGAYAALYIIPSAWQSKFTNYAHGIMPGVSLAHGAFAEAGLSFLLNLAILWSIDTKHRRTAALAPFIATSVLIPLGTGSSGPFMNPAFAFSWFYHLRGVELWEHFVVYWGGCLSGSYLAGLVWWLLTAPAQKARRSKARLAASRQTSQTTTPTGAVTAGVVEDKKLK